MTTLTTHGTVRGRTIVLHDDSPELPDGMTVLVTPLLSGAAEPLNEESEFEVSRPSLTGAELWTLLRALPQASAEEMDESERAIEAV